MGMSINGKVAFYKQQLKNLEREMQCYVLSWLEEQHFSLKTTVDEIVDLAYESKEAVTTVTVDIFLSNEKSYSVSNELPDTLKNRSYSGGHIYIHEQHFGENCDVDVTFADIKEWGVEGSTTTATFLLSDIVSIRVCRIPLQRGDLSRDAQQELRDIIESWWKVEKSRLETWLH